MNNINLTNDMYIHMSKSPLILNTKPTAQNITLKPEGLWYALGNTWISWCKSTLPGFVGGYIYQVDYTGSNILKINNQDQLIEFTETYKLTDEKEITTNFFLLKDDRWRFPILMRLSMEHCNNTISKITEEKEKCLTNINWQLIDWKKISSLYDGIEISPYINEIRYKYLWYYGWDVPSGCIWNYDNVKVTLLTDKGIK